MTDPSEQPAPQETTPQAPPPQDQARSFFAKLFDFSFSEFITLSLIKLIYIILLVFITLGALFTFIAFASQGGVMVVVGLIVAPILFLVWTILTRVWLEVLIVAFRIADNTSELVRQGRR